MHFKKRPGSGLILLICLLLGFASAVSAHHGWGWAGDDLVELTGEIVESRLGNPHGEVDLDVDGDVWTVEVGQPWRNERVGLTPELLEVGRQITVLGNASNRDGERLLKAVRVTTDEGRHDLYPGRIPESD